MIKLLAKKIIEQDKKFYIRSSLSKKRYKKFNIDSAEKFLLLQLNSIGDAIMTRPAWLSLKAALPESHIDLVCRSHIAPLFKMDDTLRQVYSLESNPINSWRLKDKRKFEKILNKENYDVLVDFTGLPISSAICAEDIAPPSCGFNRDIKFNGLRVNLGEAYDKTFSFEDQAPIRETFMQLVSPWIQDNISNNFSHMKVDYDSLEKAKIVLKNKKICMGNYVIFHPGAKWIPRRWPSEHWRNLIDITIKKLNLNILVLGGPGDENLVENITSGRNTFFLKSYICKNINIFAAMLKLSSLCVCNDSSAMHLAAALGLPTVAIFGPGTPYRTAPPKNEKCNVLYDNPFCSPCVQYYSLNRCKRGINYCMKSISADLVLKKIDQSLKTWI